MVSYFSMSKNRKLDFAALYARFQAPIAAFDCGNKCAPYNERGVPFCCDTHHAVPTVYQEEWAYLRLHTDLWHPWQGQDEQETQELQEQTPDGQLLVACLGHRFCQRGFRSLTCRSFPFFPYISMDGEFLGLSYYWEFEDRCWVISNLQVVTTEYRRQFVDAYEQVFESFPEERENFRRYSDEMRQVFRRRRRSIPLLHRNGLTYKLSPHSGRMRRVNPAEMPNFGPYRIAAELPFPEER